MKLATSWIVRWIAGSSMALALAVLIGAGSAFAALIGVLPMNPRIVFAGGNTNVFDGTLTVNSLPVVLTTEDGVFLVTPVMAPGGFEEVVVEIHATRVAAGRRRTGRNRTPSSGSGAGP